jgi:hypothetical protein
MVDDELPECLKEQFDFNLAYKEIEKIYSYQQMKEYLSSENNDKTK